MNRNKNIMRIHHLPEIIIILILFLSPCVSIAQDKLYKTDNTMVEVKVLEIRDEGIKYKRFSNMDGPLYTISKSEVKMIVYENGEKEIYNDPSAKAEQAKKTLQELLSEDKAYFEKSSQQENGNLELIATSKYTGLMPAEKRSLILALAENIPGALLMVKYGTVQELWTYDKEIKTVRIVDQWDLSGKPAQVSEESTMPRISHPWFTYIGGQFGGNKYAFNLSLNLRVGFFLLRDRWDMAATFSGGTSIYPQSIGTSTTGPSGWSNVGFMTRVHFPIKKSGFCPNIGGQVSFATSGGESSDPVGTFVAGFRWMTRMGSLDLGVNIGQITSGMGGYSLIPNVMKRR